MKKTYKIIYFKKLFSVLFLFVAFNFIVYSKDKKTDSVIQTKIGQFIYESEGCYSCTLGNDDSNYFVLAILFEPNTKKDEIDKMIENIQTLYLDLQNKEKEIILYASENAADGKYKDIISESCRLFSILLEKNNEDKESDCLYYYINTDHHIRGCDFICVTCNIDGTFESVDLVGWQD